MGKNDAMSDLAPPLSERPLDVPGAAFAMVEWRDTGESNAERPIAPLHVHHEGEEAWYVLEGVLGIRLGDRVVEARAGSAVVAQRGTPHTFWNGGAGPCRYIVVMTPEILRLIESFHSSSRDSEALATLFRQHGSELL